jgi:hypothetical protein
MPTNGVDQSRNDVELLRDAALMAGLDPRIDPQDLGVRLDSPDDLLARFKEQPADELAGRRTRRFAILAATSIAASALLVFGVLQPWHSSPAAADTPPVLDYEFAHAQDIAYAPGKDATSTLQGLATAARAWPEPAGVGRVQHIVTDNWFASIGDDEGADDIALIPTLNETWLSPDGSFRLIERAGTPLTTDGRGITKDVEGLKPRADETQPADTIDPTLLSALPEDPARLRPALLKATECDRFPAGNARARCLIGKMQEYNSTYVVPTRITAELWDLIAEQGATRLLGEVKDRAGRRGIGISLIPSNRKEYRQVLIASPETGQVLGFEEILIKTVPDLDVKAPAITSFTAFLTAERVDRAGPTAH